MTNYVVHRCRLFDYTPCAIHCIASSRNSSNLAVSRADGSIEIWNTSYCLVQKLVIAGATDRSIESLIWLGHRLLSGGLNGDITEYDLTNATIKMSVDSYGGAVWCLCTSPDENHIAAGCEDGSVKIFDTTNKAITFERSFDKQEGRILSMSWHPDGDVIVTGSVDIIRVWSTKTGHAIQRITIERLMNKVETIVWSVLVLKDYTIVSGDSYGRVQFWNGKNATMLKSHQVHRADVLCLCLSDDERSVYGSGVDPKIFEFNLVSREDPTSWVVGRTLQKHTHDVRALAIMGKQLVSGGVDTNLMMRSTQQKNEKFSKSPCFPAKSLVSVSKTRKLLLLQYPYHLDVWKLASSHAPSDIGSGKEVPTEEEPIKFLQIKTPNSDTNQIVCSRISPCGRWVVYSTSSRTRLYRLQQEDREIGLKINRVYCVGVTPSHMIAFTPDSNHVIISATNHRILVVRLDADTTEARLVQVLPLKNCDAVTHLLAVSSNSIFVATADTDGDINVFDITSMTHHCSIPRYRQIPTAIAFHPTTNDLIIAYDDLQVLEYNITTNAYTKWTKDILTTNKRPILVAVREATLRNKQAASSVITKINHQVSDIKDSVFLMSRDGIYIIDRTSKGGRKTKKSEQSHIGARICLKFTPLLHSEFLDEDTLFVVERPLQDIHDQLPPTLYQKKFGT